MAAPNMNGRLHLTGVHQKPPASFPVSQTRFVKGVYSIDSPFLPVKNKIVHQENKNILGKILLFVVFLFCKSPGYIRPTKVQHRGVIVYEVQSV